MSILEHTMQVMGWVIQAVHDGRADTRYAAELIAESGGRGVNEVYFSTTSVTQGDIGMEYDILFYYDIGINRFGTLSPLNDSALINMHDRSYLVQIGRAHV